MPDIAPGQGDLTQESFVDFKENQRSMGAIDQFVGRFDTFQKRPKRKIFKEVHL